jgi:transcription antitermination factor NusG
MLDAATQPRIHTPQRDTGPADVSAPTPSGNRWHVVYTHPQAERRATQHLAEQGYTAYLPMIAVRRRDNVIRSLLHRVEIPLFPRYAFVQFDAMRDPWMPIMHTLGVRSLLCRPDGTPEPCRAGAVEAVRAVEALAATQLPDRRSWAPGMACSLATGVLRDTPAVVLAIQGDAAYVSMMMLGHLREISVQLDCLKARDAD